MPSMDLDLLLQTNNFLQLMKGLWVTLRVAFLSISLSILFGILFGFIRLSKNKWLSTFSHVYLESMRIIPILVWLFLLYFGLSRLFGINLGGELVSIIVFVLWGTAELGELLRGSITSLPKHQTESAKALGMDDFTLFHTILLPQAIKRTIPGAVNLATRMIKTTSLVVMVGVSDVVKVGKQIVELNTLKVPATPFIVYGFIFILYFLICYPLTQLSKRLEKEEF